MAPTVVMVNDMLNNLDEEDFNTAVSFIQYLSDKSKNKRAEKSKNILDEIQGLFSGEESWDNENDMLVEMAQFRRERMGL